MSLTDQEIVYWMEIIYQGQFDLKVKNNDPLRNRSLTELENHGLIKTSLYRPAGAGTEYIMLGSITAEGMSFLKTKGIIKD
jgi:hypothetical protein